MGFSYGYFGLVCDHCGAQRNTRKYVKKIECPYGYCQAWACCDVCRSKKLHMFSSCSLEKKTHKEHCKPLAEAFDQEQKIKKEIEKYFSKPQPNGLVKCLECESFLCGYMNKEAQIEHLELAHKKELIA